MPSRRQVLAAPEGQAALTQRTWVAASPALSFATVLAVSVVFPSLWPPTVQEHLRFGVGLELVAIHSFLFFLVPILLRPSKWWHHLIRWAWVALLIGFYAGIALQSSEGLGVLVDILLLLATTYGALLLRRPDDNLLALLMVRWLYCFLSFAVAGVIIVGIFGDSYRALYALGALYFGALGFVDSINGFERFVRWRQTTRASAQPR